MTAETLRKPQPEAVRLDPASSAIAVLDLSVRCEDPEQVCSQLMERLGAFLERARAAAMPIVYTNSLQDRGTPREPIAAPLKRRDSEPVLFPDAFDKFYGGELQAFLSSKNVKDLVIVGSSTHVAVLYTATAAARVFRYNVIIPIDGVNATTPLDHDYALHQLKAVPARAADLIRFSTLATITFG
jgi:nicotinamidase-related amidase